LTGEERVKRLISSQILQKSKQETLSSILASHHGKLVIENASGGVGDR